MSKDYSLALCLAAQECAAASAKKPREKTLAEELRALMPKAPRKPKASAAPST